MNWCFLHLFLPYSCIQSFPIAEGTVLGNTKGVAMGLIAPLKKNLKAVYILRRNAKSWSFRPYLNRPPRTLFCFSSISQKPLGESAIGTEARRLEDWGWQGSESRQLYHLLRGRGGWWARRPVFPLTDTREREEKKEPEKVRDKSSPHFVLHMQKNFSKERPKIYVCSLNLFLSGTGFQIWKWQSNHQWNLCRSEQ